MRRRTLAIVVLAAAVLPQCGVRGVSLCGPPEVSSDKATSALGPVRSPSTLLAAYGSMWVVEREGASYGLLVRFDPVSGRRVASVRTGGFPSGLAAGGGAVWVSSFNAERLERIDIATNARDGVIIARGHPSRVVYLDGVVWAIASDTRRSWIARANGSDASLKPLMPRVVGSDIASDESQVWAIVSNPSSVTLKPLPVDTPGRAISVPSGASRVLVSGDRAWVLSMGRTGQVLEGYDLHERRVTMSMISTRRRSNRSSPVCLLWECNMGRHQGWHTPPGRSRDWAGDGFATVARADHRSRRRLRTSLGSTSQPQPGDHPFPAPQQSLME